MHGQIFPVSTNTVYIPLLSLHYGVFWGHLGTHHYKEKGGGGLQNGEKVRWPNLWCHPTDTLINEAAEGDKKEIKMFIKGGWRPLLLFEIN